MDARVPGDRVVVRAGGVARTRNRGEGRGPMVVDSQVGVVL